MPDELAGYLQLEDDGDIAREVGYYVLRKMDRVGFDGLSHAERVVACLTELEMEVNNSGFDQYYWNAPGDHTLETVAALRELGAGRTANLLVTANAAFGHGGPSRDREERWKQIDALAEDAKRRWFELDGNFDEHRDNLSALVATYIRAHRTDFKA